MLDLLDELDKADGGGVVAAVVDSGVTASHPWLDGRVVRSYQVVEQPDGQHRVEPTEPLDPCGHGTAVAGQVRRFAPACDMISIRVLGDTLRTTSAALLAALSWLREQPVHLVNMSLSTQRHELALHIGHAVDDLYARNVACVCARGYHRTGRAYPTYFASTIAVTYERLAAAKLIYRPNDLVEFEAAGVDLHVAWNDGGARIVDGSSYACPLVTGLAARMLSLRPDLTPYELKSLLKAYAQRQQTGWWQPWMDAVGEPPKSVQSAGEKR
jgi:subtilisin family serine protease